MKMPTRSLDATVLQEHKRRDSKAPGAFQEVSESRGEMTEARNLRRGFAGVERQQQSQKSHRPSQLHIDRENRARIL
jgi:hypothetical protein